MALTAVTPPPQGKAHASNTRVQTCSSVCRNTELLHDGVHSTQGPCAASLHFSKLLSNEIPSALMTKIAALVSHCCAPAH